MKTLLHSTLWFVTSLILAVLAYLLAALLLGVLPKHMVGQPDNASVLIYLETNGVHTDLLLPARNDIVDWTPWFLPQHNRPGKAPVVADAIAIGWGDRQFYLDTPTWDDLKLSTALKALTGMDTTLLHVSWGAMPAAAGADRIALRLTADNYRRLVTYIQQSTKLDAQNQTIWLAGRGYGSHDAFYEAKGHYSMFVTCNEWVRRGLDAAQVRVPWWSPFDKALFWQLQH